MNACCETPAFQPPINPPAPGELRTVVLIGPPNSGKSTLFNRLTGLRQKVANFPGVTVEQHMGVMAGVGREDPVANKRSPGKRAGSRRLVSGLIFDGVHETGRNLLPPERMGGSVEQLDQIWQRTGGLAGSILASSKRHGRNTHIHVQDGNGNIERQRHLHPRQRRAGKRLA